MAIYLEMPKLDPRFPFRVLVNDGKILTTPHWHREIELLYVEQGAINLGINDVPYLLSAGESVLINGGDIHYVLASPGSKRIVFQFDLSAFQLANLEELDLQEALQYAEPVSSAWQPAVAQAVAGILTAMEEEFFAETPGYQLQLQGLLYELMVVIIRQIPKTKAKTSQLQQVLQSNEIMEMLASIFQYVEQNYQSKLSLQEIADFTGYSKYYFTKFFKKNTGKTFLTFLNEYRIDKAKWLLIHSEDSVSEIISQVGIESDKTFYRLFKQSMNQSPLDYRKKMKLIK
ncbi:AraC family transcriptional regulator [Enterococcus asini]|uniref:AraC family transcriptional regulator n=1 Tax=Enterococcus TaxID=1350 RepID=UPI002891CDAC|nr:AraC family transcriptional regulator [Enterococcus asini]MDT2757703.1 AraC family transcriptional regulator [Enterococcus asini]